MNQRETMVQDEVAQMRVGGFSIGIVGLRHVMESMAGEYADKPDHEVQEELLARLHKRNYIPQAAVDEYKKAFLREFRKFLGRDVAEDRPIGLEVKVLGQGCAQCDRLEQEVKLVMSETGLAGNVEHVRDIKEIGRYGVMGTPALIINGKVKSVGKVPPKAQLLQWFREAKNNGGLE